MKAKYLLCDLCNYKSERKSNIGRHIKTMHEESIKVEVISMFECSA